MNSDCRRITLVLRNQASTPRNWNARQVAPSRLIFVNSLNLDRANLHFYFETQHLVAEDVVAAA
jgi:hypothetical protein